MNKLITCGRYLFQEMEQNLVEIPVKDLDDNYWENIKMTVFFVFFFVSLLCISIPSTLQ